LERTIILLLATLRLVHLSSLQILLTSFWQHCRGFVFQYIQLFFYFLHLIFFLIYRLTCDVRFLFSFVCKGLSVPWGQFLHNHYL